MNQINEISSIEEVASYMTNLSYIDREIKSMNLLSTDKTSLIDKLKPEEKLYDKMVTQYNGNYQSFSEVFNDFYKQNRKEIGVRSLAIRAKVSTATVTDLLKDNDSKKSNSMRRLNGLEQSRDKILSQFDINPPESLEEIIKLPIFTK
jgi:predicted CopG family antitoxin